MFTDQSVEIARLEQRANSGARWFFWIAGLSLVTFFTMIAGSGWRFIISLGTTQLITEIAKGASAELGDVATVIAVVFNLLAAGLFVGLGVLAGKRYLWAYLIGMIFFGLDALIFVLGQDWIGIIFHVLVIYWIFSGFNACRQLLALQRELALNQASNSAGGTSTPAPVGGSPSP
jgi:hypothetical protein